MYIAYVDRQKYILRSKIQFHILAGDEYASIKDIFTRLIGLVTKKIIDWLCHSILCRQFEWHNGRSSGINLDVNLKIEFRGLCCPIFMCLRLDNLYLDSFSFTKINFTLCFSVWVPCVDKLIHLWTIFSFYCNSFPRIVMDYFKYVTEICWISFLLNFIPNT